MALTEGDIGDTGVRAAIPALKEILLGAVSDAVFTIQDDGDTTKQAKFQASGITTATTRTYALPDANTTLVGTDNSATLSGKRINPRVGVPTVGATITPDGNAGDVIAIPGLNTNTTIAAPSGTPVGGQVLIVRIDDDGSARTLTFNAVYRFSSDLAAPTTTVAGKTMWMWFIYHASKTKWDCFRWITNFT